MASLMGKEVKSLVRSLFLHTCWGLSPGWVLMSNKMYILSQAQLTLKAFKKLFSGVNSLAMRRAGHC
jgi:hypothetical protein